MSAFRRRIALRIAFSAAACFASALLCSCSQQTDGQQDSALQPDAVKAMLESSLAASMNGSGLQARRSEPYFDPKTSLMLPAELDGLFLKDVHDYGSTSLGVGLKYEGEGANPPVMDVFLYSYGSKPPKDGSGSPELRQAFNAAMEEVSTLATKGLYKNLRYGARERVELPAASSGKTFEALSAKLSFEMQGRGALDSMLLVTAYKGQVVKLRFTQAASSKEAFDERSARLASAFAKLFFKSRDTQVSPDTKDVVLKAVKALEDDPLALGVLAAPAIISFSKESEDVIVVINPSAMPWLAASRGGAARQELLLAAYIGGNIRKQLLDSKRQDSPMEGLQCLIKVYSKIKEADPKFRSFAVERLLRLNSEGRLQDALKGLSSQRGEDGKADGK